MRRATPRIVMAVLVASLASIGSAQVCTSQGQLDSGCAMDDVANDWTLVAGTSLVQADGVGHDAPPSAEMTPTFDEGYGFQIESTQCLELPVGQSVWVGIAFRFESGTSAGCNPLVYQYTDSSCSSVLGTSSAGGLTIYTPGLWAQDTSVLNTFLASATHYRIGATCHSSNDTTLYLDDVWTATVDIPVFADGFETDDTTAWSKVVPP